MDKAGGEVAAWSALAQSAAAPKEKALHERHGNAWLHCERYTLQKKGPARP